ncbi:Chromatin structure-remodeling complex subunit snf21, partial [Bienertia sinuspersici]
AEWRIHMLPIQFLHVTASPIVDMRLRCKTNSKDYPSGISPSISKVLLIDTVRCELQGHDTPSHFKLAIHGTLYSDRRGVRSRLKSQLEIKLTVNLPSVLPLIPEYVLKTLLENMKDKVISNLLADYDKFRRERQMNQV